MTLAIRKTSTPITCGPSAEQTLNDRLNNLNNQVSKLEKDDTNTLKGGVNGYEFMRQGREFVSTFEACNSARDAIAKAEKNGDISPARAAAMQRRVDTLTLRADKSVLPIVQKAPWYVKTLVPPDIKKRLDEAAKQLDTFQP